MARSTQGHQILKGIRPTIVVMNDMVGNKLTFLRTALGTRVAVTVKRSLANLAPLFLAEIPANAPLPLVMVGATQLGNVFGTLGFTCKRARDLLAVSGWLVWLKATAVSAMRANHVRVARSLPSAPVETTEPATVSGQLTIGDRADVRATLWGHRQITPDGAWPRTVQPVSGPLRTPILPFQGCA